MLIASRLIEKLSHHYEEGKSRVRVKATGETGLLESVNAHHGHNVRLDGPDHFLVECHKDEIEPEAWQSRPLKPTDVDALRMALSNGGAFDQVEQLVVQKSLDSLASAGCVLAPDEWVLRLALDQCGAGDSFVKRAGSGLRVGQDVREKRSGRIGKIIGIRESGIFEVMMADGVEVNCLSDCLQAA